MTARTLDIRGLLCPMTWARVRVELDAMAPGEQLVVTLDHRPAVTSIRHNAQDLGHEVLETRESVAGTWEVRLEAGAPIPPAPFP